MALGVGAAVGLISPSPTGRSERICLPRRLPRRIAHPPRLLPGHFTAREARAQTGFGVADQKTKGRTPGPCARKRVGTDGQTAPAPASPARRHSARALPSRELSRDSPYPSGGFAGDGVYPGLPAAAQGPGARPPPALTRGSRAGLAPRAPHARVSPSPSLPSPWAAALPTPLCTRGSRGPERSTQHSRSHRRQVAGLGSEAGMWP